MTALPEPKPVATGRDVDIWHNTECHDDNRSLCGLDVTDHPIVEVPIPGTECVVCLDLDEWHCGCDCGCCDGDGTA